MTTPTVDPPPAVGEQDRCRLTLCATYRLQLRPGFGFAEVAAAAPYLAALGISHVYLSPCLQAAEGSSHGYDVVDPTRVSDALGGAAGFAAMCSELDRHDLGRVLDVVPNHMATAGRDNPWWWHVLENGPASRYAPYFDLDWEPPEAWLKDQVLLPVLGDQYGRELEAGRIVLEHRGGVFVVRYFEHELPVAPRSLRGLLAEAAERCRSTRLAFLADAHGELPEPTVTERAALRRRQRDRVVVGDMLCELVTGRPEVAAAIDGVVTAVNESPDALHDLLERQSYRLAHWQAARRDLDYRRFFDIHDLVGLRVEDPEVFLATHEVVLEWVRDGLIQGLRVDHPDGLRDPEGYLMDLRSAAGDAWIVVEKILIGDERLPERWPVEGTTGYEFINLATGLLVDPDGEEPLSRLWQELSGDETPWPELLLASKRLVLRDLLGSEVNRLSALFVEVCEGHRRHRDHSRHELREALIETAAAFAVYRSYLRADGGPASETDRRRIRRAIEAAREARPDLDPSLFDFLAEVLQLHHAGRGERELALRFQQLTGATMAKGLEDTALYRFHRLLALNEVGGDPGRFGVSPQRFHRACADTLASRPATLLASSTHDNKRSEDVRARLAVLSEIPGRWRDAVLRWSEACRPHLRNGAPEPATEYLLFQTLVGAWPIDAERLAGYLEKAAREAKVRTSWTRPDPDYEAALRHLAAAVLADEELCREVADLVDTIRPAADANSLALKLLTLTAPGVPDVYQGTEVGDFSLVDPDNRRPVSLAARARLLAQLEAAEGVDGRRDLDARKLWVVRRALELRRRRPELFGAGGAYEPLEATGPKRDHVVAFLRGGEALTLVQRLVLRRGASWGETEIVLPPGRWRDLLGGTELAGGVTRLGELLEHLPVALLERRKDGS